MKICLRGAGDGPQGSLDVFVRMPGALRHPANLRNAGRRSAEQGHKVQARGVREGHYGRVEDDPGFGPVEVAWDDATVSIYPAIDLKVIGKARPAAG